MKDLLEKIDTYIKDDVTSLTFGDKSNSFTIEVSDYIDVDTLATAVDDIVLKVKISDFDYYLFDILMAYYVISLFTNIPIPTVKTGDAEAPDYTKCYDICTRLDLIEQLCESVPHISDYIAFIEKNVWRKLEYDKEMAANDALTMVCEKAYDLLDGLEDVIDKTRDVDLQTVMSDLKDASAQVLDLKEAAAKLAAEKIKDGKEQGAE